MFVKVLGRGVVWRGGILLSRRFLPSKISPIKYMSQVAQMSGYGTKECGIMGGNAREPDGEDLAVKSREPDGKDLAEKSREPDGKDLAKKSIGIG